MGGVNTNTSQVTTGIGTINQITMTSHPYAVGDFIVIQTAGEFHPCFVSNIVDVDTFDFFPDAPNPIGSGVTVSASVSYYLTNSGQPTFTPTMYWADKVKSQGSNGRVTTLAVENFSVGAVPTLVFGGQGINFSRTGNSPSPVSPTFDSSLPPVVLGAKVSDGDGNCIDLSEFSFSLENTITNLNSVCPTSGIISSRYSGRTSSGTFNPYTDDTTTTWFDRFDQDNLFSLSVTLGNPSSTTGEIDQGSVIGLYIPTIQITEVPINDVDGTLVDAIAFNAHSSLDGTKEAVFFGFA
jgi:hypothetical protein